MNLLIKKAVIVCANSKYHLQVKDILIANGIISKIAQNIPLPPKTKLIEGKQLHVSIGWADIFANFGEPGFEHKETLQSGALAAAYGGYTDVCIVPNTKPCIDNKSAVQFIVQQSKHLACNIHPLGAVSQQTEGKNLAEMLDMQHHGAIAFTDGWHPIQNELLLLKALQYVKIFNGIIFQVPIHTNLTKQGIMNEGSMSTSLGLQGSMDIAEHIFINRDIELLRYSQSKLHITGVSTARGIQLIRAAKKEKLNITCSVTP
jgi:dihydroorotase